LIIGSAVAHYFGAFEMTRLAWSPPAVQRIAPQPGPPPATPAPAIPLPAPAPREIAIAPAATPPPAATPTPAPAFDLPALARNPAQWPKQLLLTQPQIFPVTIAGRQSGYIKVPAGTAVKLIAVTDTGLTIEFQNARQTVAPNVTDLAARGPAPPSIASAGGHAAGRPLPLAVSRPAPSAPRYSIYNQPLRANPDFPPPRNPGYLQITKLLARSSGAAKPPAYRPQPFDRMACYDRYGALTAPGHQKELAAQIANDLRQVAWQFENGTIEGKSLAIDASLEAARFTVGILKDRALTLAICQTFVAPNYRLVRNPAAICNLTPEGILERLGGLYEQCGEVELQIAMQKMRIAEDIRRNSRNGADGSRLMLAMTYKKHKRYREASALLGEITDNDILPAREMIPELDAAALKQAEKEKAAKMTTR